MGQGQGQGRVYANRWENPCKGEGKTQQSEATAAKEHSNTLADTRTHTHTLAHSFIDRQLNFPESRCLSRRRCRWQRQRLRLRPLCHPCCQCQREFSSHFRFPRFAFAFYLVFALLCAVCICVSVYVKCECVCVCVPLFVTNMKWKLAFHALTLDHPFPISISIPISARLRLRLRHAAYSGLSVGSAAAQRQCQRHSCRRCRSRSLSRQIAEQFTWKIFGYPFETFLFSEGADRSAQRLQCLPNVCAKHEKYMSHVFCLLLNKTYSTFFYFYFFLFNYAKLTLIYKKGYSIIIYKKQLMHIYRRTLQSYLISVNC